MALLKAPPNSPKPPKPLRTFEAESLEDALVMLKQKIAGTQITSEQLAVASAEIEICIHFKLFGRKAKICAEIG